MRSVFIPEKNKDIKLWPEPEWTKAIAVFEASRNCDHLDTSLTFRVIKDGRVQYVNQCQLCGQQVGSPVSQKDKKKPPQYNEAILPKYNRTTKSGIKEIDLKYAREQIQSNNLLSKEYNNYLDSDEWKNKRKLILKRAQGICEGCLVAKATQVHHLTYDNFREELMFELVALCQPCHDRIPNVWDEVSEHETGNLEDIWEALCCGCRWQGNFPNCGIIDKEVSVLIATGKDGHCGPDGKTFEPLK